MNPIKRIVNLFVEDPAVKNLTELDNKLTYEVRASNLKVPSLELFLEVCKIIPKRDRLDIIVTIDEDDGNNFYTSQRPDSLEDFLSHLLNECEDLDDDSIVDIKIEIFKNNVDNTLSVYFIDKLIATWKDYRIKNFWFCFNRVLENEYINFEVMEQIKPFYTKNISFATVGSQDTDLITEACSSDRRTLTDKLAENCHFANSADNKLIPEDFHLCEPSENEDLNELFTRHSLLLSLVFLFDITSREQDDQLYYKLRGYRQLTGEISGTDTPIGSENQYFDIYQWVYNEGNLSDKIGLARNVITIHVRRNNPLQLIDGVLHSIKSGYDIYLKQNISQYITTKAQVIEGLQNVTQRANQIVESIAVPFRNSLLAVATFFASMVIVRVSLTQSMDHIFTKEIGILSLVILGLSLSYMLMLLHEVKIDKERFSKNYENLKKRYEDILDELDLKKIFNYDRDYKTDLKYIDDKKCRYRTAWFISHIILVVLVIALTSWEKSALQKKFPPPIPSQKHEEAIGNSENKSFTVVTKDQRPDSIKESQEKKDTDQPDQKSSKALQTKGVPDKKSIFQEDKHNGVKYQTKKRPDEILPLPEKKSKALQNDSSQQVQQKKKE